MRIDNAHEFLAHYRSDYADGTIKRDLAVVVACVNYWVKLGVVNHNPYPAIKSQLKPKKQDNKGRFTKDEQTAISECFVDSENSSDYSLLVDFLFETGLRPEEAIALTWSDIDLQNFIITINKTYSKGELRHNTKQGKKGHIVHRKYKASERLMRWLYIPYNHLVHSGVNSDDVLVFPAPTGTYINWGNFNKRHWKPLLLKLVEEKKVRKYLKLYCMRHAAITNMIKRGDRLDVIAAQVGTSIEMITKTYLVSNDWWLDEEELN